MPTAMVWIVQVVVPFIWRTFLQAILAAVAATIVDAIGPVAVAAVRSSVLWLKRALLKSLTAAASACKGALYVVRRRRPLEVTSAR